MDSYELTPLYRHTPGPSTPSITPKGVLISLTADRIVLRNASTFTLRNSLRLPSSVSQPLKESRPSQPPQPQPQPGAKQPAAPNITAIVHSPASDLLLAYSAPRRQAWVWQTASSSDEPVARIDIGPEGCAHIAFTPDGQGAMLFSNFHQKVTIQPLLASLPAAQIRSPKHASPAGYSISPAGGEFMALLERHGPAGDHIGIYASGDTEAWRLLRHWPLPQGADADGVLWSPCGRQLVAWEGGVNFTVLIYSPDGRLLTRYSPGSTPAASSTPSAVPFVGLGVRSVSWAPSGDLLAAGSWDGAVRLLARGSTGWACVAELSCGRISAGGGTTVWREPAERGTEASRGIVAFVPAALPYQPEKEKPEWGNKDPKAGIRDLSWSNGGKWLAVLKQAQPKTVYIFQLLPESGEGFNLSPFAQSVLCFSSDVRSLSWRPAASGQPELLAIASGDRAFTTWTEPTDVATEQTEGVPVPSKAPFALEAIRWAPDGRTMVLSDRETFCAAFLVAEEEGRTWIAEDEDP